MKFKKEVPSENGYYFVYLEGSGIEILERVTNKITYGEEKDCSWRAMGSDLSISQRIINMLFFGDKIEMPEIEEE